MANTICECGAFTLDMCPECQQNPLCKNCKATDEVCADCAADEDEVDEDEDEDEDSEPFEDDEDEN